MSAKVISARYRVQHYYAPSFEGGIEEGLKKAMPRVYTRKNVQAKRRYLRRNMPKSEVILWTKLKNRQILGERFLQQYSVDQYIIDFYCPRLKLAIEMEGDSHFNVDAEVYNKERQDYIESFGIHFLRFTNEDIYKNLENVSETFWQTIEKTTRRNPDLLMSNILTILSKITTV